MDTESRQPYWQVGDTLKSARQAANLTQSELARVTNIPARTIAEYEQGRCLPSTLRMLALMLALGPHLSADSAGLRLMVELDRLTVPAAPERWSPV